MSDSEDVGTEGVIGGIDDVIDDLGWLRLWLGVALAKRDMREGVWGGSDYTDEERGEARRELAENEAALAKMKDRDLHEIECALLWLQREIERRKGVDDPSDDESLEAF